MKEIYRDQCGEFVCGYWGLKGQWVCHFVCCTQLYGHNVERLLCSWDALENEVNKNKGGSICIITVC